MRILILEDDQVNRRLLIARLEQAGHQVDSVNNGHQGFQLATANTYDAIISDIHMPHWDGFRFIDAMQVVRPNLPIIICSASMDPENLEKRLQLYGNVRAVLTKPVDFNVLSELLAGIPSQSTVNINKKARIVCTIGPASERPEVLGRMILAGMDVARLNFSHGTYEQHAATLKAVREAEASWEKPIAILQDLCGPKIRVGAMEDGAIELVAGRRVLIQSDLVLGTPERISTIVPEIIADLRSGDPVLLDDGLLELRVIKADAHEADCEIVTGGILKSNKGMNLPATRLSLPSITDKDWQDLAWGLDHSVDYVALSFVRSAKDIMDIRAAIARSGKRDLRVVAKVEKPEAVKNIREIIEVADAVMIARGDMGVELPAARVPRIQQEIIRLCWECNKPVITATQMLDSMTVNARPTRAEVTDVSMAVREGTDAVMLSQETATGVDPVNVVRTMAGIICEEERYGSLAAERYQELLTDTSINPTLGAVVSLSTVRVILLLDPEGRLYPMLSKWSRRVPTILVTRSMHMARHATLYCNIVPMIIREPLAYPLLIIRSMELAREWGYIRTGDAIAVIEGQRDAEGGLHQLGNLQILEVPA